jgi:anthranilate phosphoribosyltransferase
MRFVLPARKQIGQKTIFNILGPLINPARATNQLIGVYSKEWAMPLAQVLRNLGSKHILVVYGADGLDEVTTCDKTYVVEVTQGLLKDYEISPEDFGLKRAAPGDLDGGSVLENMEIVREVLSGKSGPRRDIVLINAACAIYAADKAKTIAEGLTLARESIDSGQALKKLQLLKEYSQ